MIWSKTEEQRLHVRISGQRDCQLFATLSHWKDSKTRLRRGPCHPDTQAHNHLWHKWCCQQSQLPVHISRSEDSPPPPRSKIECHHQCIWPPGNYLIGRIRLLCWALMLLLSSIYHAFKLKSVLVFSCPGTVWRQLYTWICHSLSHSLFRFWNTQRHPGHLWPLNWPSNVREISSSNFGTTRCTRL